MCVRRDDDGPWEVPENLSFRHWTRRRAPRAPTQDDLDYHVTTLFPPVRPRGHLELRMMDAQPGEDGWTVPLAVTAALFDDPEAAETAYRTVKPLAERTGAWPPPITRCGATRPVTGRRTRSCGRRRPSASRRRWPPCPGSGPRPPWSTG